MLDLLLSVFCWLVVINIIGLLLLIIFADDDNHPL